MAFAALSFALFAQPCLAFDMNVERNALLEKFDEYQLADLTVGDAGLFEKWNSVCVMDGVLHAVGSARVTDSEYGPLWKLKVIPGGKVEAEVIGDDGGAPSEDDLEQVLKHLAFEIPSCEGMTAYFSSYENDFREITTIDGSSDFRALLNLHHE
ncbi:hypothetical protein [Roseovarius sp. E0-M6]|uniref:hypothetical protein n=1 Tax=Roseovarius sp. E0-M6 TaxID=3127118 RepID=UPI00301019CB